MFISLYPYTFICLPFDVYILCLNSLLFYAITVLPAKSDSDVMFIYNVIRD